MTDRNLRYGVYLPPFGPFGDPTVLVGIFPNPGGRTPTPDELAATLAAVRRAGLPSGQPFDVAIPGNASPAWPEPPKVDLDGLAQAGMTWWMESLIHFDPLELSLEIVDAGAPPCSSRAPAEPARQAPSCPCTTPALQPQCGLPGGKRSTA